MILYKTIEKEKSIEKSIEKSRFIAHIKPVETREDADDFIKKIKKKHKDATHNVPAMVIGDKFQIQWASDDGEPQGTSGAPIVQMLVKEGITNVVVVVTRYFGGIKLGTGGLVRAYTSSAKEALLEAGIKEVKEICEMVVEISYNHLAKIQNLEKENDFKIKKIDYFDVVILNLVMEIDKIDQVKALISNVSAGKEKIISEVKKNS